MNITPSSGGIVAFFKRSFPSPYPNDVKLLRMDVEYQTDYRVRIKVRVCLSEGVVPLGYKLSQPVNKIM